VSSARKSERSGIEIWDSLLEYGKNKLRLKKEDKFVQTEIGV